MSVSDSAAASPRGLVLADLAPGALVRDVLLIGAYVGLIGLSAQVRIELPFTPVPITGQTFAVLLGAAALGTWRAATGTSLYLALGLAGVPLFAAASSVTMGYIVGFVAAAALVGWLAEHGWDRSPRWAVLAMVLGNLVIYAVGVPWLAVVTPLDLAGAVDAGAVPFLGGDAAKIVLAAAVLPTAWRLVRAASDER